MIEAEAVAASAPIVTIAPLSAAATATAAVNACKHQSPSLSFRWSARHSSHGIKLEKSTRSGCLDPMATRQHLDALGKETRYVISGTC